MGEGYENYTIIREGKDCFGFRTGWGEVTPGGRKQSTKTFHLGHIQNVSRWGDSESGG